MSSNQEYQDRLRKLEDLKSLGIHPYPERYEKTHYSTQLLELAQSSPETVCDLEDLKEQPRSTYRVAGRIKLLRTMGKLTFIHLLDDQGTIQICFMQDVIGKEMYKVITKKLDLGDFIGVAGDLFVTKHGETTLLCSEFTFLGKALRPLPDKFHGLKDPELLYRQRYLDLIANSETKKRFEFRSHFIKALREFYWKEGFMEVETPTFLETATGAAANPYRTHHDALDLDMVLRISHELPLKKLIVGGFEKVFEIGKVFRNEGIDPSHLPEHTHIEHYAAYWNFEDNIAFTERMFDYIFDQLGLDRKVMIKDKQGTPQEVDFSTPWARIDYLKLFQDDGFDILSYKTPGDLLKVLKERNITIERMETMGLTTLIDHVFKKLYRPHIIQPTIVYNYPIAMQPLARKSDKNPEMVDQFQFIINSWEVLKAYSELVDPVDQRERFIDQAKAKADGDEEAMDMEEDFLISMEHGMPPISGWGMGVDRIVTLLTGQDNLRDTVFFPLMKPKKDSQQ